CVSWTQGEIGYWLARELTRQFTARKIEVPVVAINTLTEVDPSDPAFQKPTKPVGKFIDAEEAQRLYEERGWIVGPDANRGYRRLVPSPRPLRILEADSIRALIERQCIALCGGGGGIPVYRKDGVLQGIEAVIDKDFTSCLLAKTLQIDNLIICTEVEHVYLDFGKPEQRPLRRITVSEATAYLEQGHFGVGSMAPKVAAMIDYVRHGGKRALITSLEKVTEALAGQAGTEIYADQQDTAVS
ncbi:MAG TPA: carbamate kinase, partial [Oculatellaceae cyanobacterium]